jgi:hypothetical protein
VVYSSRKKQGRGSQFNHPTIKPPNRNFIREIFLSMRLGLSGRNEYICTLFRRKSASAFSGEMGEWLKPVVC